MPARTLPASAHVNVGILWGPDSIAGTAAAVVDVLRAMNTLAAMRSDKAPPPMRWCWLALPGGSQGLPPPVPGAGPLEGPLHAIVLPGWLAPTGPQLRDICSRHVAHFGPVLRSHLAGGGLVAALFTGSHLLADCGLLAGRKVALPWVFAPSILMQPAPGDGGPGQGPQGHVPGPALRGDWQRDRPWQRDGSVWTTASLQEAMAAMLDLLSCTPMAELAQAASAVLRFDPPRQLTAPAGMETPTGSPMVAGALEQARRWLQAHRSEPYSLQATARAASTSPRTLLRWFAQEHGQTPQDYLHGLRVAQAQTLLQTTYLTVEDVALQCGYGDAGSLRKVFMRLCGMTPGAWRQRFRLRTTRKQWRGPGEPPQAKAR